jgi:hypothetical protein
VGSGGTPQGATSPGLPSGLGRIGKRNEPMLITREDMNWSGGGPFLERTKLSFSAMVDVLPPL